MNDLVNIINNQAVTSSRMVAEKFGKNHRDVLEKIRDLSAEIPADLLDENYNPQFHEHTYLDSQGKKQPEIVMNRDKANVKELNTLDEVETMILKVIQIGMAEGKQYKEIYQDCKQRLILWQTCTFKLGKGE